MVGESKFEFEMTSKSISPIAIIWSKMVGLGKMERRYEGKDKFSTPIAVIWSTFLAYPYFRYPKTGFAYSELFFPLFRFKRAYTYL
jgi:hypothetical protein